MNVEDVVADELAESDAEVRFENRDLRLLGDVDAGFAEQVVLAVAGDHSALSIEHHVRIVDKEAVWRAVTSRAVDLLMMVDYHVHLEMLCGTGYGPQRLRI